MEIKNKVAIVTGGASGIGEEIVVALLDNGIKGVVICDINEEIGKGLHRKLSDKYKNNKIIFMMTDITNRNNFEEVFKETMRCFKQIDILINNAGVLDNDEKTINVNMIGTFHGIKLGFKYMSKENGGQGGTIINMASITGIQNDIFYAIPVYAATKSAVIGMVRSFGHSHYYEKSRVSVMAICPGYTATTNILENIDSHLKTWFDSFIENCDSQLPVSVANAAIYLLNHPENGSVWIIDGGNLYKQNYPEIDNNKILVKTKV